MKIIFYCQYVWGMGHLFRSIELVRALDDHQVTLIAGGQPVDFDLPAHATLLRLPTLFMDEKFTRLIPGNPSQSVSRIQSERQEILFSLFKRQQPDLFMVELYPFGRTVFGYELDPLLTAIRHGRFGSVGTICSLRDILVEKKDPVAFEQRALDKLNEFFDALLVHSDPDLVRLDETFTRVAEIKIPIYYTGFVTQHTDPNAGRLLRQELSLAADQRLIVASAGGGRSGYKLLNSVLSAFQFGGDARRSRLEVFAGPFMDADEFEKLRRQSRSDIRIRRFTRRFLDYLYAADLSISLAGYNTCMNLLVTGVPALIYPYYRQREQPMRLEKIKNLLPMRILREDDLKPAALSKLMEQMLQQPPSNKFVCVDLNGAQKAACYLNDWMKQVTP
jgi:predicted glycosyltransferase